MNADFEVLGGCFALVALLFAAGVGAIWRALWKRRARPAHDRLVRLMVGFVAGEDRSLGRAAQIEDLLTTTLARDRRYEELSASVAAFAPRETAAFRDEARLVGVFQTFLKRQGVAVWEHGPDQDGLWPPAPRQSSGERGT